MEKVAGVCVGSRFFTKSLPLKENSMNSDKSGFQSLQSDDLAYGSKCCAKTQLRDTDFELIQQTHPQALLC